MPAKPISRQRPAQESTTDGVAEVVNNNQGQKFRQVKWSVSQAAVEFDIDKGALARRLKALGMEGDSVGRFSTVQICAAKYGDLDMERARKVREDADGSALDNAKRRHELGEVRLFMLFLGEVGNAIKQHIAASSMTQQEQDDLCEEMAAFFDGKEIIRRVCPE